MTTSPCRARRALFVLLLSPAPALAAISAICAVAALAAAPPPTAPAPAPDATRLTFQRIDNTHARLTRGGHQVQLDLGPAFDGCRGQLRDPSTGEHGPAEVSMDLIDATERPPFTYLLLLIKAASNCDVQGECGGGGMESTLVWLKLDQSLAVAARKSALLDSCSSERSVELAKRRDKLDEFAELDGTHAADLVWTNDRLRLQVTDRLPEPATTRCLSYDRSQPHISPAFGSCAALSPSR